MVRAQVLSFKEKEFIRSSFALGASPMYVIFKHLIPNSVSPVIVGFVQAIPLAMMLEAGIKFSWSWDTTSFTKLGANDKYWY